MRRKLCTLLLLLTGLCFMASVLELDKEERNKNYEKETHAYLFSKKCVDGISFHYEIPTEVPEFLIGFFLCRLGAALKPTPLAILTFRKPPGKIYLRNQVLLI